MPTVLVSAEHERRGVKHDASSVWVEDLATTSFKICIRELQNFDGAHQNIHVVSNFQQFLILTLQFTSQCELHIFKGYKNPCSPGRSVPQTNKNSLHFIHLHKT